MSAADVIQEIKELPLDEKPQVIEVANPCDAERMLTGKELAELGADDDRCDRSP